jgi:hypothetical protein
MHLMHPIDEEWDHLFRPSEFYPYTQREFRQAEDDHDDFVTFSEPYSLACSEPVWFYSWGNARWLRPPHPDARPEKIDGMWWWVMPLRADLRVLLEG